LRSKVKLEVYTITGRYEYEVNLPRGVYVAQLKTERVSLTRKLTCGRDKPL